MLKDLNDQIATLRDNISYVQDNINECQTSIVQMEENKVLIAYLGLICTEERDISSTRRLKGPFSRTVSEPVSVAVAFNVYHCANGDELECLTDILEPILFVSVDLTVTVTETICVNGP